MIVEILGVVVASILAAPLLVLATLCIAALRPRRPAELASKPRPRCAILVPAHDEELSIARTVTSLMAQLLPGDRLTVVADNCSDRTAEIARSLGAAVVERSDERRRGKGFALDFGVRSLEADPPAVVLIVDADCTVNDEFVARLVHQVAETGRPAQSCNLVTLPAKAGLRDRLAWFAFVVKNFVRPLGLWRLGMPCLMSTGNAFPWSAIGSVPLASGNLVEDMQLGLDLAIARCPASFCPEAQMRSAMPRCAAAVAGQRSRWEHGHLQTILTQAPRLIRAALRQRRLDLLALAIELSIPPLSLLVLLALGASAASLGLWYCTGTILPAYVLSVGAASAGVGLLAAWVNFGRDHLSFAQLLAAPVYAAWKLPIYAAFFVRRQKDWVRTARH